MSVPVVFIGSDYISISDEKGEIVYWDCQEWYDDPDIIVPITEAIRLALTEGGDAVRARLQKEGSV